MSEPIELLYPLTGAMLVDVRKRGLLLDGDRISVRREVEASVGSQGVEDGPGPVWLFETPGLDRFIEPVGEVSAVGLNIKRVYIVEVRRRRPELAVVQVAFSDEQLRSMRYGEDYVADMLARSLVKLAGPIPRRAPALPNGWVDVAVDRQSWDDGVRACLQGPNGEMVVLDSGGHWSASYSAYSHDPQKPSGMGLVVIDAALLNYLLARM